MFHAALAVLFISNTDDYLFLGVYTRQQRRVGVVRSTGCRIIIVHRNGNAIGEIPESEFDYRTSPP